MDGRGNVFVTDGKAISWSRTTRSRPSLSFATPTPVGSVDTTDGPQTVTVQNIGNAPLTFQPFAPGNLLDAVLPSLHITDCTELDGLQLAPGDSCTLDIEFQPAQSGLVNGHVNVVDNTLNTGIHYPNHRSAGHGNWNWPRSVTQSQQLDIPKSSAQHTEPRPTGHVDQHGKHGTDSVSAAHARADFLVTSNCSATLATNGSCTINVIFTPTAAGTQT